MHAPRPLFAACTLALLLTACPPPPTLEDERPGEANCGMLNPNEVLPVKLCRDQRRILSDEGKPHGIQPGPGGGLTWVYRFASGDVFGQRGGFRYYDFDAKGVLKNKRQEFTYRQEK